MATKTVDELSIQVSLDAKKMQESLGRVEKRLGEVETKIQPGLAKAEQSIAKFANRMNTVMTAALDLLALKFSVTFGKNLIETFANTGSKLHFLSQQVGESVGTLDKWGVAIQKAGGNADSFFNTVNNLHNKLVDMKYNGDAQTAGMFGMLGIKTSNADHSLRNTTDILLDLSDALKGQDKGYQQWVGRSLGIDDATLRALSQGREAVLALVKAQDQLYSEKNSQQAVEARNKLIDFDRKMEELGNTIAVKLLPIAFKFMDWLKEIVSKHSGAISDFLTKLAKGFLEFSMAVGDFIAQHGSEIVQILKDTGTFMWDLVSKYIPAAVTMFKKFRESTGLVNKDLVVLFGTLMGFKAVVGVLGGVETAIKALTTPLGAVIAAVSAIKWVYDLYNEYKADPEKFKQNHGFIGGAFAKVFQQGELVGSQWYDSFGDNFDNNAPEVTLGGQYAELHKKWGATVEKLRPAIGQIETGNNPKNFNTGNGAYGRYQIRPTHGNNAWIKAGGSAHDASWYLNEQNNLATYKLMMMQNLEEKKGNEDEAIKEYSGKNYGLTKVLAQKVKNDNPALASTNPAMLAKPVQQAVNQANQVKPAMTQQSESNPVVNVQNMYVEANEPKELASAVVSKANLTLAFAGSSMVG